MDPGVILFFVLAVLSVGSACGVVFNRSPIRSALLLVINFVILALLYVMLNAQVLALLQVLVYAGAIMVLFVFVIQLLNLGGELTTSDPLVGQKFFGVVLGLALLAGLVYAINFSRLHPIPAGIAMERIRQADAQGINQVQIIGWDLFTKYVYPFELTSILLLVGVIGVMNFTRHRGDTVTLDG